MHDLLIRNGRVIDPSQNLDSPLDLAFDGDQVAVLAESIDTKASETIDAQNLLVVPGLIDLHVHVFDAVSHYGIPPDPTCLERGVTTALDAGSAGAAVWPGFRKFVIEASETRLYAMLNISRIGLVTGAELDPPIG